jgi:hypothetical protein
MVCVWAGCFGVATLRLARLLPAPGCVGGEEFGLDGPLAGGVERLRLR